jgi:YVTN family beta-propeller protein
MSYPQIINTITVGRKPTYISSDGTYVWANNNINNHINTISQIQINTHLVIKTITSFLNTAGISSDGTYVWVTNSSDNTVSQIEISTQLVNTITVGQDPNGISSDGTYVWVTNSSDNTVSQIEISTHLVNTIIVGQGPTSISSDGTYVWVTNSSDNTVSQIEISTHLVNTIIVGQNPNSISSDGTYVWVTNSSDNTVNQIEISTHSVIKTITGFLNPYDISSDGIYVWVTNSNTIGTVSQIQIAPTPIPPPISCFKSDTKILCIQGYVLIQDLRNGDLVKTVNHGYIPIDTIGKREIYHICSKNRIKDQLYKCSQNNYPEISEDLIITGCHCILTDAFISEEQKVETERVNGKIYVTDGKYRLPACIDKRSSVYEISGNYTIYHLALQNDDNYMNYGIYANGLLVETCSKRYLKELSGMTII